MKKYIELTIVAFSGISGWILNKIGLLYPALVILFVSMVADYVSGMLASKYEAYKCNEPSKGWSSKRGIQGIMKKFSYLIVILVTILVDYVILNITSYLNLEITGKSYFSLLMTIWFCVNEWISILENAGRMGVLLPDWCLTVIMELKNGMDKKGDDKENG